MFAILPFPFFDGGLTLRQPLAFSSVFGEKIGAGV